MTEQSTAAAKPTHRIYIVVGEGKKAKWTEIAAAWPHSDGKGYGISASAIPLQGRIVMREIKDRPAAV